MHITFFLTAIPYPYRFKAWLLRLYGAKIGKGVVLKPRLNIHLPWKLEVGDNTWIGEEASILSFEKISIGNNVCISQRAFICAGNHDFRQPSMTYRNAPIVLKDGCWIGSSVFIGPGITIETDTIVMAGTVVSKSLPANSIYKGNPSIYIKPRWND